MGLYNISRDTLELGEQVEIIYSLKIPAGVNIVRLDFSALDSLVSLSTQKDTSAKPYYAEVDWLGPLMRYENKQIPVNKSMLNATPQGFEYVDTFFAVFWDIGVFNLRSPLISFDTFSRSQEIINVQNPIIFVTPPMNITNPDTTQLILPIETIIPEGKSYKDYLKWLYVIAGIFTFALFWFFVKKLSRKPEIEIEHQTVKLPAHDIALSKLSRLRQLGLWQKGEIKEFQSELTHIIREYLENRFKIPALESTTVLVMKSLKTHKLGLSKENDLNEILQIADLVKFAKANPPIDINEVFLKRAEQFVIETKLDESILLDENPGEDE